MTDHPHSPTAPPGKPGELENALSFLQCVLVARRTRETPEKITWQQYDVLENLRIHGPMTPSALGRVLGISRQTTSKALRILKDMQLIEQTAGTDRREQTTALTHLGREFLTRAAHSRRRTAQTAAGALTAGEESIFAELCLKVAQALDAMLRSDEAGERGVDAAD